MCSARYCCASKSVPISSRRSCAASARMYRSWMNSWTSFGHIFPTPMPMRTMLSTRRTTVSNAARCGELNQMGIFELKISCVPLFPFLPSAGDTLASLNAPPAWYTRHRRRSCLSRSRSLCCCCCPKSGRANSFWATTSPFTTGRRKSFSLNQLHQLQFTIITLP